MIPLKISLGEQRCSCECHEKRYLTHEKECCVLCVYCKFRIKIDNYQLHKMCHEVLEQIEAKK